MFEWFSVVFLFLLGLAVGSHVNVLILRFGFSETSSARSECTQCTARIPWYDLIPVLSYLSLQGRCRSCGSHIARQYPLVELGMGILFALVALYFGPAVSLATLPALLALLLFFASAVAIVAYDMRHTLIPIPFTLFFAVSALLYRCFESFTMHTWTPLIDALLGGTLLAFFFSAISVLSRGKGMGMGDAHIAGAMGILLGVPGGIGATIIGVWAATATYLFLMVCSRFGLLGRKKGVTMKTELPFAPWLILGCTVAFFAHVSVLDVSEWLTTLI